MRFGVLIHAISACNFHCDQCGQGSWRKDTPTYKISLEQIRKFLDVTKTDGHKIRELLISGGEPTLWKDLEPALKLIKEYKDDVVQWVTVYSNGSKMMSDEVIKNLDKIIISKYADSKEEVITTLYNKCVEFKKKFKVKNKRVFWEWPKEAIPDTIPSDWCSCKQMLSLMGDEIQVCDQMAEIEKRYGVTCNNKTYVAPGYMDRIDINADGKMDICSMCIENQLVQRKIKNSFNY